LEENKFREEFAQPGLGGAGLGNEFEKKVVIKETTTTQDFGTGLHGSGMHSTGLA